MKKEENYGILASIDRNSNKWQDNPTSEDLSQSKFGNVIKTGKTFTSLNFAHKNFQILMDTIPLYYHNYGRKQCHPNRH